MAFLRHRDLFPDAPAPERVEPVSGVQRVAKKRASKRVRAAAPAKTAKKKAARAALVPVLMVPLREVRARVEDARARWLAPFIDGAASLDEVLASSALGAADARAGMDILVDEGLVALV